MSEQSRFWVIGTLAAAGFIVILVGTLVGPGYQAATLVEDSTQTDFAANAYWIGAILMLASFIMFVWAITAKARRS